MRWSVDVAVVIIARIFYGDVHVSADKHAGIYGERYLDEVLDPGGGSLLKVALRSVAGECR